MKFLLSTTTGIAALVAGAGIAMAQDQSAASTSPSSMGADATCADIANLGEDEAERALYFLAGLHHGQDSSGSPGMSGDSAAAMPSSSDTGSSSSAASSMPTDGGAPSTDSASTTTPGGDAQGSSGMAESPSAPLPADSTASATGAAPADSGGAGSTTGTDSAASSVPSGDQSGSASQDTAASSVPSGDQSGSASQDTAGAVPGIESESGDDSMQDLAEADSGIDQTTTAGVSGNASGAFMVDGYYDIPVDMVMADCRTSPDSSISEVLSKHNSK